MLQGIYPTILAILSALTKSNGERTLHNDVQGLPIANFVLNNRTQAIGRLHGPSTNAGLVRVEASIYNDGAIELGAMNRNGSESDSIAKDVV